VGGAPERNEGTAPGLIAATASILYSRSRAPGGCIRELRSAGAHVFVLGVLGL